MRQGGKSSKHLRKMASEDAQGALGAQQQQVDNAHQAEGYDPKCIVPSPPTRYKCNYPAIMLYFLFLLSPGNLKMIVLSHTFCHHYY